MVRHDRHANSATHSFKRSQICISTSTKSPFPNLRSLQLSKSKADDLPDTFYSFDYTSSDHQHSAIHYNRPFLIDVSTKRWTKCLVKGLFDHMPEHRRSSWHARPTVCEVRVKIGKLLRGLLKGIRS